MKGTIGGLPCRLLVDCGANSNFISERVVGRYGLSTSAIQPVLDVRFADGRLTTCTREVVDVTLSVPGLSGGASMVVLPGLSYDVILGMLLAETDQSAD